MKTLTLRLRGSKTELEEMGEDVSDMATTTSQLQAKLLALTGGQVDIMLDENTFKNSTQILREMAAAWESMNDIQRASALELMGGKRQANVLSALIQNFDTVESVIETSANSAGSALRENERWLDSIAGKIDQFNNAVQALWQNLLGSDIIKGFIDWGTKIIKSLDTTQGKILAIVKAVALLMAYKKINPLDWIKDIGNYFSAIKADGVTQWLKSLVGLAPAMKAVTAETVANTIATQTNSVADQQAILQKIGLAGATGTLNAATRETIANNIAKLVTDKAMTVQMGQQAAAMLGYTLSVDAAGKATVALDVATKSFMASNPIGWILLAVSALMALAMWISQMPSKTEKLTEELKELQSELSDIKSELESVNSELETTQDRMAELLAKDKLSFTEKEELNNLKKQNDELQRRLDLLELQEKQKHDETAKKFVETMFADVSDDKEYYVDGSKASLWSKIGFAIGASQGYTHPGYESTTQTIDRFMNEYQNASDERKREIETYINGKFSDFAAASDGIEYFTGDNLTKEQQQSNEWLDLINNKQDKWAVVSGGKDAKANAINRIFNKDENAVVKENIDNYVEALKNGDKSAGAAIDNIIRNNSALSADLQASGIKIDEATDYFTSFASEMNYETIDGKVKEVEEATKRLKTALSEDFDTSSLDSIKQALTDKGWVDTEGNLMSEVIAEYFGGEDGGISEKTRVEIERLVKQIYDGKLSVDDALKQFEYFGIKSTLDIYISEVQTNFKDVFVELEEADGLIDTFEELGEAIGSTADALKTFNKAEAEMANSGRVSIETALQLMEYTDDYSSILEVVDGKLQLVDGAEEALIQTRIDAIRTSAEASLASAEAAYSQAQDATTLYQNALSTDKSAEVVASAWEKVLAAGAGLMAGIKSLITDETWTEAYNRAYNETLSNMTGYEISYDDAGLQSLIDAEEDAKNAVKAAQDRVNLANQLTSETLESINDADDVDTVDDVKDDRFQKEMDYWENRIAANQARYEQIQNEIDLFEAKGQKADASFYEEQIKLENERLRLLGQQKKAAQAHLSTLKEGSEEWWDVANTLNDIEGELDSVTASIVDLQDAIGEIDAYKFEEFNNRLDNLTSKLETIRNLIAPNGEEDWFDDEGQWTEAGVAVLGAHIQELEFDKEALKKAEEELNEYSFAYEGNEDYYEALGIHSEQEYYDKVEELTDQQYQYLESISDTEQSIVDMYESNINAVEEYTQTLVDSYNDYIDSVKEALDAERDYTL